MPKSVAVDAHTCLIMMLNFNELDLLTESDRENVFIATDDEEILKYNLKNQMISYRLAASSHIRWLKSSEIWSADKHSALS